MRNLTPAMQDVLGKCSVCGRGYVAIFTDEVAHCADQYCPGLVTRLAEPIPRSEWREPDKKTREARIATAPPRDGEVEG